MELIWAFVAPDPYAVALVISLTVNFSFTSISSPKNVGFLIDLRLFCNVLPKTLYPNITLFW